MTPVIFYSFILFFTTIFLFDYFFNQKETNQNNIEHYPINYDTIYDNSDYDINNNFDTLFNFFILSELIE